MNPLMMSEKEMMEDCLNSQKHMAANYNAYAGECDNSQLRSAFLNILSDEQELGAGFFEAMKSRGWYQVEEATQSDISKAKQNFVTQKS